MTPESGRMLPDRIRIRVDFPAPFSPINPTTSWGRTSIEASRSALTTPKLLLIALTASMFALFVHERAAAPYRQRDSGDDHQALDSFVNIG